MAPRIAIIGAGPAGTTLARLLANASIPVTIYEGEASANVRTQGGTLDLHTDTGVEALKQCGLYDEFLKHARYDGEALTVADKYYRVYFKEQGSKGETAYGRPEIDRRVLREMLLSSLDEGVVQWGRRVKAVEKREGAGFTIVFNDGSEESGFDLLIGADGAFSKVRPVLTSDKPYYSGIGGIWGTIPDAEKRFPQLSKQVNRGSLFCFSDGKGMSAQQLGDGSLNVSATFLRSENWSKENDKDASRPEEYKATLKEIFSSWNPRLTAYIDAMDNDSMAERNLYMLPVGNTWKHKAGVTLMGDAAHLMTPYAGEGVNLAMADSLKLAHFIIEASKRAETQSDSLQKILSEEVDKYEQDMFKRAKRFQQQTYEMMTSCYFVPSEPYLAIERWVLGAVSDVVPYGLFWLVRAFATSYFWVYKRAFLKVEKEF